MFLLEMRYQQVANNRLEVPRVRNILYFTEARVIWVNLSQFLIRKATIILIYGTVCFSHRCLGPCPDVPDVAVLVNKAGLASFRVVYSC
jgi:hypothetical protein